MPSDTPANPYPLAPGTVVDRKYSIERILGEGGMGVVYLARDLLTETRVVLKAIRTAYAGRPEYRDRILAEGRALAKIDNPNVVRLNAIVVEDDALFLVMQYVEGESVEDLIHRHVSERRPLPVAEAVRVFRQAVQGVGAAHNEGIIHRDIKPANILIRARDGAVKVTDFGIAKAEEDAKLGRGKTRGIIGTAPYMAPEQCMGKVIDKRVDIYALGVVLFEMLSGQLPFESDNPVDIMVRHVKEDVPSITALRPDVPPELDAVLQRACARSPEERFASCDELLAALDRVPGLEVVRASGAGFSQDRISVPAGFAPAPAAGQPSTVPGVPGAPPFAASVVRTAQGAPPGASHHAAASAGPALIPAPPPPPSARGEGQSWGSVRIGLLLGAVGAAGVLGAYALGLLGPPIKSKPAPVTASSRPSTASTAAAPSAAPTSASQPSTTPTSAPATPATSTSTTAPPSAGPDLSGAWTSDSGRAYDVAFRDGAYEFRIRDVTQFPSQGYEAGEPRFRLRPIPGELETYLVEDRIRPFPPDGTSYELQKARDSCVEIWTEIGGRPLRAQLDGQRLWVRMALVEPSAEMFVRQGSVVVGCEGLREARASEVDSFLTRKK